MSKEKNEGDGRKDSFFAIDHTPEEGYTRFTVGPQNTGLEDKEVAHPSFIYLFMAVGFVFLFAFSFVIVNDYGKATDQTSGIFYLTSGLGNALNGIISFGLTGHVVMTNATNSSYPTNNSTFSKTNYTK